MTLTLRDKIILLVLAFIIGIYAGYQVLWIPATAKIAELEENKRSIQNLSGDLKPLIEEAKKLEKTEKEVKDSVNNIKTLSKGVTATSEEFLVFLGRSSRENNVMVSRFNEYGTQEENGIYRTVFNFEIKGNSVNINNVLEDIKNMGIKCSFGSFSYRQDKDNDYLKRFFDDLSELPWYKEKKEEQESEQQKELQTGRYSKEQTQRTRTEMENQTGVGTDTQMQQGDVLQSEDNQQKYIKSESSILAQTMYPSKSSYEISPLSKIQNVGVTKYKAGQQMRLNVTICLIMYNAPSFESSFLNNTESDSDAIL